MDIIEFHKTTGKELLAIKDRVRNLVPHWGEDGRYKEVVLKSVIQRFLPGQYSIATGFVVKQTNIKGVHLSSNQLDLIIYETNSPVLFKDNDFVIVTPDCVKAIIEVKANLRNQGITPVVTKANENGKFIFDGKQDKSSVFFNGVFSYAGFEKLKDFTKVTLDIKSAESSFKGDPSLPKYKVNHISFNNNLFYKFWEQQLPKNANFVYQTPELSFSFFIGNLMDYLSRQSVIGNSALWFPVNSNFSVKATF